MKTAIVTDSNSGISQEEARRAGIYVLPMPVILDGAARYEGIDLQRRNFFRRWQADTRFPHLSQRRVM